MKQQPTDRSINGVLEEIKQTELDAGFDEPNQLHNNETLQPSELISESEASKLLNESETNELINESETNELIDEILTNKLVNEGKSNELVNECENECEAD